MKDIGKILKNARENKEYTQKQVMELTGIHRKSLSGYENNVAEPDLSTFATLANLYGISADEALEIGEPDPSVSLLRFEFQVLSLFKELDAKHQEELLIQITALVRYLNAKNMVPAKSSIQIILRHHRFIHVNSFPFPDAFLFP